jgi:hypothetical protein
MDVLCGEVSVLERGSAFMWRSAGVYLAPVGVNMERFNLDME